MSIRLALNYIASKLDCWKAAASIGFDPSKHPRRPDGKFGAIGPPPDKADKPAYKKWLGALVRQSYNHGMAREQAIRKKLLELYPPESGAKIHEQCYLCDNLGRRLIDPKTGEARRIDLLVEMNLKAVRSTEVTSRRAQKGVQMGKEKRIREAQKAAGKDLYAQIKGGDVVKIPYSLKTRVWRTEDFAA